MKLSILTGEAWVSISVITGGIDNIGFGKFQVKLSILTGVAWVSISVITGGIDNIGLGNFK